MEYWFTLPIIGVIYSIYYSFQHVYDFDTFGETIMIMSVVLFTGILIGHYI